MMKVREGAAPTSDACAADVANSRAALTVLDTTQRLYDQHGIEGDDFLTGTQCGDSTTLQITNVFDAPILASGIVAFGPDDKTTSGFKPFLTDPIAPGAQVAVQVPTTGAAGLICRPQVRVVVAPVGDLAADAGLGPAGDVPQASNDPKVWYPQIDASSIQANQARSISLMMAGVEDLHSPDLIQGGITFAEPPDTSSTLLYSDVCETLLQKGAPGEPGELAMVIAHSHFTNGHTIAIGLYRRGSDGIWRYLGRVTNVRPAASEKCSVPPH